MFHCGGGNIPDELVGALVPKQADGLAIHRSNNLILTDGDHCLLHSCHLAPVLVRQSVEKAKCGTTTSRQAAVKNLTNPRKARNSFEICRRNQRFFRDFSIGMNGMIEWCQKRTHVIQINKSQADGITPAR